MEGLLVARAFSFAVERARAAIVAPLAHAPLDTDGVLRLSHEAGTEGLVAMNADEMTTKVVLATERATARTLGAAMGLEPVGIMSAHVCLQVVCTSESPGATVATVLLAGITLEFVEWLGSNRCNSRHRWARMHGRNRGVSVRRGVTGVGVVVRRGCGATARRVVRVSTACEIGLRIVHGDWRATGRSWRQCAEGSGVRSVVQETHRRRHSAVFGANVHAREVHVELQVKQLVGIQREVGELSVNLFVVERFRVRRQGIVGL